MRIRDWSSDVCSSDLWAVFPKNRADLMPQFARRRQTMIDRQQQDFEFLSVPSEQWLSARIYPRDDGGLSVFVQDISRRRQAEERLRASEAHLDRTSVV